MQDPLWWRDGVIYQIYPRSFADANGDGIGDLNGILQHLDHLNGAPHSLGVDAIWLSPFYPSPGFDFGYDVSDYQAVDPLFGTLEEFDRLVEEAHRRGIRIVLDLVLNHTSHLHPWFREARSSRIDPRRDWYIWRDAGPDGGPPNNWQGVFGGSAWEWDETTGQYYYHMFLKEQPDLNWRNPEVRDAMWKVMRFWMDRGVDGFRLDVVNAYFKDDACRNNPPTLGVRAYDRQHHLYDLDRPEMATALREMRAVLDAYPDRMAVGEVLGNSPPLSARYCGDGRDQLHLAFNFHVLRQPWRPAAIQQALIAWELSLHRQAWPCQVLSNHDVDRHTSRYGAGRQSDARARVAAALLLTLRGTPFLYYGEELGLQNTPIPRREIVDPLGQRYWPFHKGRDGARTPMPWSDGPFAGFSTSRPWLRLNPDHRQRNVMKQRADPRSLLNFYRRLLEIRRESPALRRGSWRPLLRSPANTLIYLRESDAQIMLVALNFSGKEQRTLLEAPLPVQRWRVCLSTTLETHDRVIDQAIRLAPFEACILEAIV